jgi:flagellar assembly factor FliW
MSEATMEDRTTTLVLPKFGECTYAQSEVIEFPWGIPGFPNLRHWLPLTVESHPTFVWLQSLDDVSVAIPTADPWTIFENYDPKMPAYAFQSLDIKEASDFATLCVVVVTSMAENMTMNLMAPILINLRNKKARQIMLDGSSYSPREAIPRKEAPSSKTA